MRSANCPEVPQVLNVHYGYRPFLSAAVIAIIALSLTGCAKPSPTPSVSPSPSASSEVIPQASATPAEIDERVDAALKTRDPKQLKALLEGGASPHGGLDATIYLNEPEMASLLLEYGANPNEWDSTGNTALMTATFFGRPEIVGIILSKGANPDFQDPEGNTALGMACYSEGQSSILKLLLDSKADPNLDNNQGMAPLHYASLMGDVEMVKLLLDSKAQINAATSEGITPLMLAAMEEDEGLDSLQLLLKTGADPGIRDKEGRTALLWAKEQSSKGCEKLLAEAAKRTKP